MGFTVSLVASLYYNMVKGHYVCKEVASLVASLYNMVKGHYVCK